MNSVQISLHEVKGVSYGRVTEVMSEKDWDATCDKLKGVIEAWREDSATGKCYPSNQLIEAMLLTTVTDQHNFEPFTFTEDHQLRDPEIVITKLKPIDEGFAPYAEKLRAIVQRAFQELINSLAKAEQLVGEHRLRIRLKAFIIDLDGKESTEKSIIKNPLTWHWDYCGKTTIVAEFQNDFISSEEESGIRVALNRNDPSSCSPFKDHERQADPVESTISDVPYRCREAILFPGMKGKQVHVSKPLKRSLHQQGLLLRTLMQVVLYDKEWVKSN